VAKYENRRPITLDILHRIVNEPPLHTSDAHTRDALNIDTAFKVAFAGFLRLGEFTYEASDCRNSAYFRISHLTRGDAISLRLTPFFTFAAASETTSETTSITASLSRSPEQEQKPCPITALEALKRFYPTDDDEPLFQLQLGPFNRAAVRNASRTG
jgi:hypothetical protein